jgi:hypothetical protein
MTLQQRLNDFKATFESGAPPIQRAPRGDRNDASVTEDLRRSGLAERALKVGDLAPSSPTRTACSCAPPTCWPAARW